VSYEVGFTRAKLAVCEESAINGHCRSHTVVEGADNLSHLADEFASAAGEKHNEPHLGLSASETENVIRSATRRPTSG
jgi:hypothetical protein